MCVKNDRGGVARRLCVDCDKQGGNSFSNVTMVGSFLYVDSTCDACGTKKTWRYAYDGEVLGRSEEAGCDSN